ncbi:hypothetical protein GCM10023306_26470 [Novosphingobium ginsenosidimutans]
MMRLQQLAAPHHAGSLPRGLLNASAPKLFPTSSPAAAPWLRFNAEEATSARMPPLREVMERLVQFCGKDTFTGVLNGLIPSFK